jgi:hypothetical protein
LSAVKGPAIALVITASLGLAVYVLLILALLVGFNRDLSNFSPQFQQLFMANHGKLAVLRALFALVINGVVLFGALKMMKLQGHSFAIITCILAMIPCSCCCLLGLPFGIWGLVVLNKPEVKSQFTN